MTLVKYSLLTFFILSILQYPVIAGDQNTTLQISIKSGSLWKKYFEISDAICPGSVPNDCKIAEIIINNEKCQKNKRQEECRRAKDIIESSDCVEGLIFNGSLEAGETIQLNICADSHGNGRIKTRNSPTAPWTVHSWVEAGATISIK